MMCWGWFFCGWEGIGEGGSKMFRDVFGRDFFMVDVGS